MSLKRPSRPESAFRALTREQQRAWLAYMRVQLRLTYEMNRELQADSNLSLPDYDVLNALRYAPGGRMQITALAAQIGWSEAGSRTTSGVFRSVGSWSRVKPRLTVARPR
jgi:hypothetical protein